VRWSDVRRDADSGALRDLVARWVGDRDADEDDDAAAETGASRFANFV